MRMYPNIVNQNSVFGLIRNLARSARQFHSVSETQSQILATSD